MHASTIQLMRDQVRAIYRALTGADLPEIEARAATAPPVSPDAVARQFADLEALARRVPRVTERVPPFSFAPAIDAYDDERELVVEVAVPGVDRDDLTVEVQGDQLVIYGLRAGERAANGRTWYRAEIPRGPFHRALVLPYAVTGEPRVKIEHGLIRIQLAKARKAAKA